MPEALAVALPHGADATEDRVLAEQAACLGIAGITGYRAVFADGSVQGLHVIVTDDPDAAAQIRAVAPAGVNRMVDLSAHIDLDATVIATGGVICSYYSAADRPEIPYWTLGFADTTLRLLGSDDFPAAVKADAAAELTGALVDGSLRSQIAERVPLEELARAHGLVERGAGGRVIVDIA